MKLVSLTVLSGLFAMMLSGCSSSDGALDTRLSVLHQDMNRFVYVHIPGDVDEAGPVPLVIAFHGAGSSGADFQRLSGLDSRADAAGFVVAYPSASGVNWAEGCGCIKPDIDGIDDVGFADKIPSLLEEHVEIDENRVFAVGYSQGGIFLHRLACDRGTAYAGYASVAGLMSVPVRSECTPDGPVSMLSIHGNQDTVVPFGGQNMGAQSLLSAIATSQFWRNNASCPDDPDRDAGIDDMDIRRYGPCAEGKKVHLIERLGGGHTWPGSNPDAAEVIVDFFNLR